MPPSTPTEYQPVTLTIPIEELIRFRSAIHWIEGYLTGLGKEIPSHVATELQKLERWCEP